MPRSKAKSFPLADDLVPNLQDGDVIFLRIGNPLYARVAATTRSWESHVGLAFEVSPGIWKVAESTIPVSRWTSLRRYLARSENGRFAVMRLTQGLSDAQRQRLRAAVDQRMGTLYHLGFKLRSRRTFCSKFVYEVYREATGIEVGEVQQFRDLVEANPDAPMGFWKLWYFGRIPYDRETITTTSQLRSPVLTEVVRRGD